MRQPEAGRSLEKMIAKYRHRDRIRGASRPWEKAWDNWDSWDSRTTIRENLSPDNGLI